EVGGQPRATTRFALDPSRFFLTNDRDDLDFTVVAVSDRVAGAKDLADFGFCAMSDRGDKHMLGEFVNLVQHPEGGFKQLVLRENKLVSRFDTVLHYEADTEPGSSGSPVFNDEWETVALHHWGGPHREQRRPDGQPVPAMINEGIRASAIVTALRDHRGGLSGTQQALLDEALDPVGPARPVEPDDESPPEVKPDSPVEPYDVQAPTIQEAKVNTPRINTDGSISLKLEINVRLGGTSARPDRAA